MSLSLGRAADEALRADSMPRADFSAGPMRTGSARRSVCASRESAARCKERSERARGVRCQLRCHLNEGAKITIPVFLSMQLLRRGRVAVL